MAYAKTFFNPLKVYLEKGVTVNEAKQLLTDNHCFDFPQLTSGLFPALNINYLEDTTGYTDAWMRDSSIVGLVLLKTNKKEVAFSAAKSILDCFHKIERYFIEIDENKEKLSRPPARFTGPNSEPLRQWANAQNDALGYGMLLITEATNSGGLNLNDDDKKVLIKAIDYLEKIKFWQDQDSGHWEEIPKLNSSSLGVVIAGLKGLKQVLPEEQQGRIDKLTNLGGQALFEILPNESLDSGREREVDAAQLFSIEPLHIIGGEMADIIVERIEQNLVGEIGIRRYIGDSYWGPDYRQHFTIESGIADFSNPADMAKRDSCLIPGKEAQWTLFDPLLTTYFIDKYQDSGDSQHQNEAIKYLVRALSQVVEKKLKNGKVAWLLPEAYFFENDQLVPNDHIGLLWAQANLLYALNKSDEVFGESLLISS